MNETINQLLLMMLLAQLLTIILLVLLIVYLLRTYVLDEEGRIRQMIEQKTEV